MYLPRYILIEVMNILGDDSDLNLICKNLDIANFNEAICLLVIVIFALIILVLTVYRLLLLKKNNAPGSVIIVHGLMLVWGVSFCSQYIIGLISYREVALFTDYTNYQFWFLQVVPRICVFLDFVCAFTVHTLLLIVPYYWIRNIIYFIQHSRTQGDTQDWKAKTLNRVSKVYIIATRVMYLLALLPLLFIHYKKFDNYTKVIRFVVIGEAFLIMFYLFLSCRVLLKNFQDLVVVDQRQRVKIKLQSYGLMIICFIRLVQNIVLIVITKIDSENQNVQLLRIWVEGLCIEEQGNFRYMIDVAFGILIMHFAPILTILYIYSPEKTEESQEDLSVKDSLLATHI